MTTNISKEKREKLINKISAIKKYIQSVPQDENTGNLLTYIAEIEKDIKGKKYGLVFEEHKEAIDEKLENNVPVLKEDESLFINNGGQMNFLIEGDNLASLHLLEKTHKGKIDLIYIDPPYNTGNEDFIYDDKYIDTEDSFKHSKWLSFMSNRLDIAYNLLSNKGLIFISIDDIELAPLKLLCENKFGDNFVAQLVIETGEVFGTKAAHASKTFVKVKDYVLIYQKKESVEKSILYDSCREKFDSHYNTIIINNERFNFIKFLKNNKEISKYFEKYNLDINAKNINILMGLNNEFADYIYSISDNLYADAPLSKKIDDNILNSVESGEPFLYDNKLCFKTKTGSVRMFISFKDSLKKSDDYISNYERCSIRGDLWKNFHIDMRNIDDEGEVKFKNGKKPVRLIQQLIKWSNFKNSTILDFFSGSGTTGHAVMKLNAEDGGNRKFILCTNNENNICRDVTYERIKRVIEKENYKASLKYMKVDFVPITDKFYYEYADELLKNVKELVELENAINFKDNNEIAIILTENELDEFTRDISNKCKTIYIGHNVLPTQEQEKIFKDNKIKINIIPDYYYRDLEK